MVETTRQTREQRVRIEPERIHSEAGAGLDIAIGEKLMLELPYPSLRFPSEFLGMRRGEFLILTLPQNAKIRERLVHEQRVTARYLHKEYRVGGFQTSVIGSTVTPYPLLFLTFPSRIEVINLRHDARVNCVLQCSIFIDGQEMAGFMTDLSRGGARFVAVAEGECPPTAHIANDAEACCRVKIPGADGECYLRGLVKNPAQNGPFLEFGFKFEELDTRARRHIQRYVKMAKRIFDDVGKA